MGFQVMVMVHASPATLEAYRHPHLGVLSSPRRFYRESEGIQGWPWAADNDAFSSWDDDRFRRMLREIRWLTGCLFVTAPDVVGDAAETLRLFDRWYDALIESLQPIALVAQDGLEPADVPWRRLDALFVGGSTEWKLGPEARELVAEAKTRGLWVHMGRVNSTRRIQYAQRIGCDSFDGTSVSWFRDTYLRSRLSVASQLMLEAS